MRLASMSDSFSISVSFKTSNAKHLEAVQTMLEHVDLYETDEAKKLLRRYQLDNAQLLIENLTNTYSKYTNDDDLVEMYLDTYHENITDEDRTFDIESLVGKIDIEGNDTNAYDYCPALVLLLYAIGATNIKLNATSPLWSIRGFSDDNGDVHMEYREE
jgi:hypothetical protein